MPQLKHSHLSICYETFGKRDHPCLIFISGLNGQLINWPCEMMQNLADRGLYIIIFDNRDVGLSTYYDHLPSPTIAEALTIKQQGNDFDPPYTLQDMASDVITLLDGLKIKQAHVAGISMGGIISQILALNYPERILSLIIHGDYDPVFPVEHGYHLAECLPNSRLEIIENLGHGLPEPVYEKFIEHICKHMNKT